MSKTDVTVEIYYSGAWHDVTADEDIYTRDPIRVTRGRPDRASTPPPSQADLTVENRDFKYGPRIVSSPLYRLIGRNTPLRIALGKSSVLLDSFTRTVSNDFGSSTSGHAYTVTGTAGDYDVTGSAGTIQPTTLGSPRLATVDSGWVDFNLVGTFRFNAVPASGNHEFGITGRYTDTDNRYVGLVRVATTGEATLYLRKRVAGVTTDVEVQATGVTLATATDYRVRFECYGEFATVKVWAAADDEPTDPLDASILSGRLTGLATGTRIGVYVTNNTAVTTHVITIDNLEAAPQFRFHGEVPGWPVRWNVKGNDVWVPVTAFGPRRRFSTPGVQTPVLSAVSRSVLSDPESLLAWWSLEDGFSATVGGSGLPGGTPTKPLVSPAKFGAQQIGASGSPSGIDFSGGGSLIAPTGQIVVAAPDGWEFEFVVAWDVLPTIPTSELRSIAHAVSSGVASVMGVGLYNDAGTVRWAQYIYENVGSGVIDFTTGIDPPKAGRTYHVNVRGTQVGAGVRITIAVDGVSTTPDGFDETLMMPSRIALNTSYTPTDTDNTANPPFLSGLSFRAPYRASSTSYLAGNGHVGETAAERIARVCAENGIASVTHGVANDTEPLSQQQPGTVLDVLDEAATSDGGILMEARHFFGFVYRTHVSLYNQEPALTLSYALGGQVAPGLEPEPDTRDVVNDVTATNVNGSFARLVQETGRLNVAEPGTDSDAVGRLPRDYPVSVQHDSRLLQQAGWLRRLGTWDEDRYPVVSVDLNAMDVDGLVTLIDQAIALEIGGRLVIEDVPDWIPEEISQVVQGMVETLASHQHRIDMNTTPERPWRVGILDSSTNGKLDCRGSTLASGIDDNDTALSITVTDSCLWSTTSEPYDIVINTERMTVTTCTGASSPQSMTVTRSVNGVVASHDAGSEVHIADPFVLSSHPRGEVD